MKRDRRGRFLAAAGGSAAASPESRRRPAARGSAEGEAGPEPTAGWAPVAAEDSAWARPGGAAEAGESWAGLCLRVGPRGGRGTGTRGRLRGLEWREAPIAAVRGAVGSRAAGLSLAPAVGLGGGGAVGSSALSGPIPGR